ncbi:serine/threonine-protein kinase [Mycobacterium hubeiense]|uniref:serine/threonine-protein kinase n=1 Tax=Mycobacterium hubeiense TaxID=1867256 RepID=UPI000C7E9173|nr:serine/threonine-protein kinase [Mycobacterium sp. QGD 101]
MVEIVGKHYVLVGGGSRAGGLSTVRKAVDNRDGSSVAVKFIASGSDELSQKVFDREIRALRSLSHPNIVKFRDAGTDESGTHFVVLEWVERCLKDLLEEPPWQNWAELYKTIAKPVLAALEYAHLNQYEHRDIKPGNILIDSSGSPLLADFGIAKLRTDELHSDYTVQNFRSGAYAPPEREAVRPYVRDVFSMGVVLLQCMNATPIKDYSDVRVALESVRVPADIREVLEACVSPDPMERPPNAGVLALELDSLVRKGAAASQQPRNQIWLQLTRSAQEHLAGSPPDRARAATMMVKDLSGEVFAYFGTDRETGELDKSRVVLIGQERRYVLKRDDEKPGFVVIAVSTPEFESLEASRRHGLALPQIFSWSDRHPVDMQASGQARHRLFELLEEFYLEKAVAAEGSANERSDELFDRWMRVLDAREELARGEHQPLVYKRVRVVGRRSMFTLAEPCEADLVGTDWQVMDRPSGRRFGYGQVIDQDGDEITVLTARPLGSLPPTATLVPYDAPSSISLNRQRDAALAVKNGTTPRQDLRGLLVNPEINAEPDEIRLDDWFEELDPQKRLAVEKAVGGSDLLVIQGPPGTGKTRFITETVKQVLRRQPNARVLIASQTHVAVDHAVERLRDAGVTRLVRLAGADDSVVQPGVRDLLLDAQIRRWAEGVRSRAESHVAKQAVEFGIDPAHLKAVLALEQLATVAAELESVENQIAKTPATMSEPSDLATAIEEANPAERLQARFDHLSDRRAELARAAQELLAGDLTIPAVITSSEARNAIELLLGEDVEARRLVGRLELQAQWLERISAEDSLAAIFLAGTSVVAGTCTGFLRNRAVGQLEFDLCVIDEASKATLTEALVPIARSKRWILVGDTRQLPPTDEELMRRTDLLEEHSLNSDDVRETLFQRLVDRLPEHSQLMLEEQYRMVRPIGDLISNCFYGGRLRSPNTQGLAGFDRVVGAEVVWLDTGAFGEKRREQGNQSYVNRVEARTIVSQLQTLDTAIEKGLVKPNAVGSKLTVLVVAPYKNQVEELRRRLAPKSFRHLETSVMSVDAVQGRESDLAFFSVTRSNSRGRLGFLGPDYWRRINVALSRARYGLVIVGDAGFVKGTNGALKSVLEYIEQHPGDCLVTRVDDE